MSKFISFIMYFLWTAAIILILATTFTNFQYEDLNMIALLLSAFAVINSFLFASKSKKSE